jgi:hypothetical protein
MGGYFCFFAKRPVKKAFTFFQKILRNKRAPNTPASRI